MNFFPRKIQSVTLNAIEAEALRADIKHRRHSMLNPEMDVAERLAILTEEFGEVGRALTYDNGSRESLTKELIQLSAMAAAWAQVSDGGANADHWPSIDVEPVFGD